MSIQTEIDRIISAVDAAHAKVAEKGGTTARPYLVANLANAIDTIPEAVDPKLQTKTVTPTTSQQNVTPDSGYDGLSKVTVNAMPTATQATPSISVSSAGLITASATQTAGYVAAGTKSATKQLTTQAAQTITPGTSNKTISSGRYLTGTQTIKGDANLVAGNIKSGVSIFGVSGTLAAGEDVTSETNTYTSHLTSLESVINSLPDAGGSGGGGSGDAPETCDVTIKYLSGDPPRTAYYLYTKYENGSYESAYQQYDTKQNDVILHNAVIGTIFVAHQYGSFDGSYGDAQDCERATTYPISNAENFYPFRITGSNPVLTIYNYD